MNWKSNRRLILFRKESDPYLGYRERPVGTALIVCPFCLTFWDFWYRMSGLLITKNYMDITAGFLILVPVVLGVVQVIKMSGLPVRWAPLLSLILGIGGAFLIGGATHSQEILQGIIVGLAACGLWSGASTTFSPAVPQ